MKKDKVQLSIYETRFRRVAMDLVRVGFGGTKRRFPATPFTIHFPQGWGGDLLEECVSSLDEIYKNKKKTNTKVANALRKIRPLIADGVSFGVHHHQPILFIHVGESGIKHSRSRKKEISVNWNKAAKPLLKFALDQVWGTDEAGEPSYTTLCVQWEPYA